MYIVTFFSVLSVVYCQQNGDVRLNDIKDYTQSNGILEIYLKGQWIPICYDNFKESGASAACKQMGYTSYDPLKKWRGVE